MRNAQFAINKTSVGVRNHIGVFGSQFSVLSSQFSVLSSQFSVTVILSGARRAKSLSDLVEESYSVR